MKFNEFGKDYPCNHHHNQDLNISITPQNALLSLYSEFFLPFLSPKTTVDLHSITINSITSALHHYYTRVAYDKISHEWNHAELLYFVWHLLLNTMLLRVIHMCSFYVLSSIPLYAYTEFV